MSRSIARTMMLGVGAAAVADDLRRCWHSARRRLLCKFDRSRYGLHTELRYAREGRVRRTGAARGLGAGARSGTSARNDGNYTAGNNGSDNAGDVYAFGAAAQHPPGVRRVAERHAHAHRRRVRFHQQYGRDHHQPGHQLHRRAMALRRRGGPRRRARLDQQHDGDGGSNVGAFTGVSALNFVCACSSCRGRPRRKCGSAIARRSAARSRA